MIVKQLQVYNSWTELWAIWLHDQWNGKQWTQLPKVFSLPAAKQAALHCTDSIAEMLLVVACEFHTFAAYSKTVHMEDL